MTIKMNDDENGDEKAMRIEHLMGLFTIADHKQVNQVCKNSLIQAIKHDLKI